MKSSSYQPCLQLSLKLGTLLLLSGLSIGNGTAQTPLTVPGPEAISHLEKRVDPVYPAIARTAGVMGDVVLQVDIDSGGHVSAVKTISAPPMLIGAATDAVKQWVYRPFLLNNVPVLAKTTVTIRFAIPDSDLKDQEISNRFEPLFSKCTQAVNQHSGPPAAVDACQKSSEEADKFSTGETYRVARRAAYVYYANALIQDKRAKDAVPIGEKAIGVVQEGSDDAAGSSAAYSVTGEAKAFSGDLVGADKYFGIAEDYQRKGLDSTAGRQLHPMYAQTLKSLLSFHAQVLTALGKPSDAQKKLDEANKL
jgi:TonB family protein